jgi:predicted metal-binding membrane protein
VVLLAVGVMSLFWMAVIAAAIFVEKVSPFGRRAARVFAFGFVLLGLVVAFDPSVVPGLTRAGLDVIALLSAPRRDAFEIIAA